MKNLLTVAIENKKRIMKVSLALAGTITGIVVMNMLNNKEAELLEDLDGMSDELEFTESTSEEV